MCDLRRSFSITDKLQHSPWLTTTVIGREEAALTNESPEQLAIYQSQAEKVTSALLLSNRAATYT